ncbi:lysophospholipid acyltransferase family protein [Lentibacter sp. XHP0401]|jgi:lyso-ornithine lipid O-acyltransferase|uniref:lysophospholipid acyltransferase family protein n=1 Tax=Lentibacter sp. XHP0401 TaxID=2984334 RepID=UPI0021E8E375|nr:lysophospholipid acyltransferase family protein [Lentibacter sp. XHP0401]MCV2892027.1 1-acyl-sn-glycerol-3-phosphate acyltransferase [Lentibacter sp. XHP0401]
MSWDASRAPDETNITLAGWLRVILRAAALIVLVFGGLLVLLALRLFERPLYGLHRPWTPYITQFVCRMAFVILGMKHSATGRQMKEAGAVVANHASWLDIFTLNARKRVYFVSKSEVAKWPGIGWLARATGTVFINRDRREARAQQEVFEARLLAGHKLLFFPEGTSTDGLRVLPFKPTLFQAFFADSLRERLFVQPVSVVYRAPAGATVRFYGWWGDMEFGPHLLKTLAAGHGGSVSVTYHAPLRVADFADRKALARAAEDAVRSAMPAGLIAAGEAYDAALEA